VFVDISKIIDNCLSHVKNEGYRYFNLIKKSRMMKMKYFHKNMCKI